MTERVVVVTGGGRGIGRAVCERFGREGACVVAAARSQGDLDETGKLVEQAGGRCVTAAVDVGEADEIEQLMEDVTRRLGRIDVLVNNAGVAPLLPLEELEPAVFDALYAVNMAAVYRACYAVWPTMRQQGGGVIVNVSSVSSVDPFPGFTAYGASKAWVNAWTRGLASEGREWGIRVFAVAPGAVETRMLRKAFPDFPSDQTLAPADVAEVIHTLTQPGCRHMSGQTVFVRK